METEPENNGHIGTDFANIGGGTYSRDRARNAVRRSNFPRSRQSNNGTGAGIDSGGSVERNVGNDTSGTDSDEGILRETRDETRQADFGSYRGAGNGTGNTLDGTTDAIEFGHRTPENDEFKTVFSVNETSSSGNTPPRRGAGRPSSTGSTRRSKADQVSIDSVNALLQLGFGALCIFLGSHWELSDDEGKMIAAPASRILAKLPNGVGRKINDGIDPLMLAYALMAVCGPRIQKSVELQADKKTKKNVILTTKTQNIPKPSGNNGTGDIPIHETKLGIF